MDGDTDVVGGADEDALADEDAVVDEDAVAAVVRSFCRFVGRRATSGALSCPVAGPPRCILLLPQT